MLVPFPVIPSHAVVIGFIRATMPASIMYDGPDKLVVRVNATTEELNRYGFLTVEQTNGR